MPIKNGLSKDPLNDENEVIIYHIRHYDRHIHHYNRRIRHYDHHIHHHSRRIHHEIGVQYDLNGIIQILNTQYNEKKCSVFFHHLF